MAATSEPKRPAALQAFLDAAEAALMADAAPGSVPAGAARSVFDRARAATGAASPLPSQSLQVCDAWLAPALEAAGNSRRSAIARALASIVPGLHWTRRTGSETAEPAFRDGHANAMILGPRGIEMRDDVWIGVTLMAPGITYPDHEHPPEEVYLPLGPGEWWNATMDWTDPGTDRLIYNPPGIRHAMRAGAAPFLALWVLPI